MYVCKVINHNGLTSEKIRIFQRKLYVINEYVVEQTAIGDKQEVATKSLCFPQFQQDYQLRRLTVYDKRLYLLAVSQNVSYTFVLQDDRFVQVHEFQKPAVSFMVSKCSSGLLFLYLLMDYTYYYVNQAGKAILGETKITAFQNTLVGALIIDGSRIYDQMLNYSAAFDSKVSQIVEDEASQVLYVLLQNNCVYELHQKQQPKCILSYSYNDFPILRILVFQQKLMTINANMGIYSLEDGADPNSFGNTTTKSEGKSGMKLFNLGRLKNTPLRDIVFAGSLHSQILIISSVGQQVQFDPYSKNFNSSNTQNYDGLINCYRLESQDLLDTYSAKASGFLLHGYWCIGSDGKIMFYNLEQKKQYFLQSKSKEMLQGDNHYFAVIANQHFIIYYTVGNVFFKTTITEAKEVTQRAVFSSALYMISYSEENDYQGFAIDEFNNFFRTNFENDPVLITRFKYTVYFSLFTKGFILIQAKECMYLIVKDRIVDKFAFEHTPMSAALLNPDDPIGHQVIALAYDNGIIEIRHLLSFKILQQIMVLNRMIKQLVVVDDELRCLDSESSLIFVLQDDRNEGSVLPVDELLLDNELI